MTHGTDASRQNPRAALDAARVVFGTPEVATAPALWSAAQQVLQLVLGRPELTGQALVGEVRRLGLITLSDAHALVALSTWADRSGAAASNEAERIIVREAWMALDHAVPSAPAAESGYPAGKAAGHAPPAAPAAPAAPPGASSYARPAAPSTFAPPSSRPDSRQWSPPPPPASPAFAGAADPPSVGGGSAVPEAPASYEPAPAGSSHRRRLYLGIGALLALVVLIGAAAWWYTGGRAARVYEDGVAAYQRGAREVARGAFVQAAQLDPDDARPLIYLGRITREEGDLPRARRFLTNAVRLAPNSAVAARELASLMLADNQPEIARRFYVRAIELDPSDRTAQGFLGCALFRLQRFDEARRWSERAGPGDWQRCVPPTPMPAPMPMGAPPLPPA